MTGTVRPAPGTEPGVWHTRLVQVFLGFNSLFWLPWGLVCLVRPQAWSGQVLPGLEVFDLSGAVARTEVRAMYGGLQMAIGVFALIGVLSARHRWSVLLFFTIALGLLAGCRLAGMVAEGEPSYLQMALNGIPAGRYNQAGLTMYEGPNFLIALALTGWQLRSTRLPEKVMSDGR